MIIKEELFNKLKTALNGYSAESIEKILKAYEYAEAYHQNQKRVSGEEFIIHPLSVAIYLADMHVDPEMIMAGLLHDVVEDTEATLNEIAKKFGENVSRMVDGVTKISKLKPATQKERKAETIRKMLFAMIKDMKVIVIKFADKIHNMQTLNFLPGDKRKKIALETLDIYAPLAGKMGMHFIKDELEDLALRWVYPDSYNIIKTFFDRARKETERTMLHVSRMLSEKIDKTVIPFKIKYRAKHYYSIFKKMKKYNKKIEEIFDLLGIRVITDTPTNCYQIFGIVHNIWQPIPGRFRDFIAHPKKNGYRSLHTTVIVERRKAVEIQIRTEEMDEFNEYGVAAHWYYKKGEMPSTDNLKWLAKLKEVHNQMLTSEEYYNTIRDDILKDEIYIFTPKGDIFELPKGATAVDFAYRIHTEVGHRCRGAKANGLIIPLSSPLKNGMVVEILTGKISRPKQSWLAFIKTSNARKKIKNWLASKKNEFLYPNKVEEDKKDKPQNKNKIFKPSQSTNQTLPVNKQFNAKITIEMNGEKNLLFTFAKCCNPLPLDPIIGFVSRGRGIIIHKKECRNLQYIQENSNRIINVNWTYETKNKIYSFKVKVDKNDNPESMISSVVQKYEGTIIKWDFDFEKSIKDILEGVFSIELPNNKNINLIIKEIKKIPSVLSITKK